MDELVYVYATAGVIAAYLVMQLASKRFDPFAPVWLFLVGYLQVYVIQAISFRDWAVNSRSTELVAAANLRALWALAWFLAVYHFGFGRRVASMLRTPPPGWSMMAVNILVPPMAIWGLYCAGVLSRGGLQGPDEISPEELLLRSFGFLLMVAAVVLVVTGRTGGEKPRRAYLIAGLFVSALYTSVWMFNGKRSPGIIGVLSTVCAFYTSKRMRPSWAVLMGTGVAAVLVVTLAIGWRNNRKHESNVGGFLQFAAEIDLSQILENMNMGESEDPAEYVSQESTEYGGFILMMSTVPEKSGYDYGANYLRTFSTFIPRIFWPDKPLFGRDAWRAAWVAGSEIERDEEFTSPAIGILGATQLNGGAIGTLLVLGFLATLLRTAYEYFCLYSDVPWVQFWWAITYFNAWFMVVNDDPLVWFYYNWGFTTMPIVILLWLVSRAARPRGDAVATTLGVAMA